MTTTATDISHIARIGRDEAYAIAAVENRKLGQQLRTFDADDWTKSTDCTLWDVHAWPPT